jgi:hypothetical protein
VKLRAALVPLALAALPLACGRPGGDQRAADTLTRRQKDSIVGASGLPGAAGVGRALSASDSATSRNRQLDSLGAAP